MFKTNDLKFHTLPKFFIHIYIYYILLTTTVANGHYHCGYWIRMSRVLGSTNLGKELFKIGSGLVVLDCAPGVKFRCSGARSTGNS